MNKVVFEDYFNKSNGQPFTYNGKEIRMSDQITLPAARVNLKITFLKTDSIWKQGIALNTKGEFEINGQIFPNKIVLWENTTPKEVDLVIKSKNKFFFIYNVWDTGDGVMHYGHNGGALFIEKINGARVYNCNDGFPDDDFDDLIFKIKL